MTGRLIIRKIMHTRGGDADAKRSITELTRRETYGSICKLLLQDMVDTGRVGQ